MRARESQENQTRTQPDYLNDIKQRNVRKKEASAEGNKIIK